MARLAVDKEQLVRWQRSKAAEVLPLVGEYVKEDATFKALTDPSTQRFHVTACGGDFEIVCTGEKWWDTRAKQGGGGAVDLVMHLRSCDFTRAVAFLKSVGL